MTITGLVLLLTATIIIGFWLKTEPDSTAD